MSDIEITDMYSGNIERDGQPDSNRFAKETGFPSPARDHFEKRLSLDEHLIRRPAATFFVRVRGDGMKDAGIRSEDILVVDRSIKPVPGSVVIVLLEGEYKVKRLIREKGKLFLCSERKTDHAVEINDELDYQVWGVVTHAIHKYV